ncbi:MAG: DUF2914 domain-containing protein [Psychrobium sp.]
MQLKIKIDLGPDDAVSASQPAPFDPVKIRNFLLVLILLSSLVCTMAYSMWPTGQSNAALMAESDIGTLGVLLIIMEDEEPPKQPLVGEHDQPFPIEDDTELEPKEDVIPQKGNTPLIEKSATEKKVPSQLPSAKNSLLMAKPSPAQSAAVSIQAASDNKVSITESVVATDALNDVVANNDSMHVPRAQLTSAIAKREPIDRLSSLSLSEHKKLFYFTQIDRMKDKVVYHRWSLNGKVMAEVSLSIGANKWRTYSSKTFNRSMLGRWQVAVVDDQNQVLKVTEFDVTQ